MIRVKVEGKNIADIWKLRCVHQVNKSREGHVTYKVAYKKCEKTGKFIYLYACRGDEIEVENEDAETGYVIEECRFRL